MKKVVMILLLAISMEACEETDREPTKLQRISWINGFWKMTDAGGTMTESWTVTDDTTLTGVGKYTDSAGRVLSNEEIRIVLRKGKLWYIPTVSGQNMGQPVSFSEVLFSDTMVVFENKEHDFPQRIGYIKKPNNNIMAYIEGTTDSTTQRIEFPYERQ